MRIPPRLEWLRSDPGGRTWLDGLPDLLDEVAGSWAVQPGEPYPDSFVSYVCPVTLAGGGTAVLKLQWPHPESEREADALRVWDGRGAVALLAHDAERRALLLERCVPGTHLSTTDADTALAVFAQVLADLWVPVGPDAPFPRLADEARRWADELPGRWEDAGRPFERRLVDVARTWAADLAVSQHETVLVDQDLHGDNVLAATRRPWLAIDPKPLVGERAFGLTAPVRSYEFGHTPADVWHRLDRLSEAADVDRERARWWTVVHGLAWSIDAGRVYRHHVDTARWLVDGRP